MSASITDMSLFALSSGEKVVKETQKPPATDELPMKNKELLKNKIYQLEFLAKKNSTENSRVALQALRRKKWCENHIKCIECATKAMRSIHEHIEIIKKVNDLMKDITEEKDVTGHMLDCLDTPVGFEGEFDEDELLAELEMLEKNLDESPFEADRAEEGVPCPKVLTTALPSHPGCCREIIKNVNDLMKDVTEDQDMTADLPESLYAAVSAEVEFDGDELLAELEMLEKNLEESLFEADRAEEGVPCPKVLTTALPSHPAKTDEDSIEDDLEYLRRWAKSLS